ncbi:Uncharacterized protein FWK35_00017691 [Aphis craccivora]|uniref:Uncharacterized protein n=1 Tax=Aphis craccivora TaxID=307492 RepID=A0A6G0Y3G4_APHCR|nr:Uncharacterized protein FWK35_00017691 [Aphis craccivora]
MFFFKLGRSHTGFLGSFVQGPNLNIFLRGPDKFFLRKPGKPLYKNRGPGRFVRGPPKLSTALQDNICQDSGQLKKTRFELSVINVFLLKFQKLQINFNMPPALKIAGPLYSRSIKPPPLWGPWLPTFLLVMCAARRVSTCTSLAFQKNHIISTLQYADTSVHPIVIYNLLLHYNKLSLNSERSNECIDFTMMCFFFFCVTVITFWSSKSTSIFKLSPVSDKKLNFQKMLTFFDVQAIKT